MDLLAPLLEIPYYLSPGWPRMDPTFDPLRELPRFQALLGRLDLWAAGITDLRRWSPHLCYALARLDRGGPMLSLRQ